MVVRALTGVLPSQVRGWSPVLGHSRVVVFGGSLPTLRNRQAPADEKRTCCFYFQVIHPYAISGGLFAKGRSQQENLKAVLEAAGSSLDRVVKTTVFLKNIGDFAAMNEIYAEYLGAAKPARTTVAVADLPRGALVEIDLIALA